MTLQQAIEILRNHAKIPAFSNREILLKKAIERVLEEFFSE